MKLLNVFIEPKRIIKSMKTATQVGGFALGIIITQSRYFNIKGQTYLGVYQFSKIFSFSCIHQYSMKIYLLQRLLALKYQKGSQPLSSSITGNIQKLARSIKKKKNQTEHDISSWNLCPPLFCFNEQLGQSQYKYKLTKEMAKGKSYLITYMVSFFVLGASACSFGGLIPFLAEDLDIEETEYSIVFTMVSISTLLTAALYKVLKSRRILPSYHTVCLICAMGIGIFSLVMTSMKTKMLQCLTFTVMNIFAYVFTLKVNISLLIAPKKEDTVFWVSFSQGSFGVGGLVGPILAGIFQQRLYYILAAVCFCLIPCYYFLRSPEQQSQSTINEKENTADKVHGSTKLEVLIFLGFFLVAGVQTVVASWIPTYAVLSNIANKQNAVRLISIFWTMNTIFRFFLGPFRIPGSKQFSILTISLVFTSAVTCGLAVFDQKAAAVHFFVVSYGISISALFPLLLSVSREFNIHLSDEQISRILISLTLAGFIPSLTGQMMNFDLNMLFYCILIYSALLFLLARVLLQTLRESQKIQRRD